MSGQLVTGDAVVLGLQPARLPSRAAAVAVDLVVVVGLYLLLSVVVLSTVLPLGTAAAAAVQVALLLLVVVGGPILVETLSHGRSLGKLLCGLRVVREDGGPIRFRHALVRGAIGFVELLMTAGSVACVASLVSARGRRLGDVFAGTLVVRERVAGGRRRRGSAPVARPELASAFTEVDLSRVPDELWLTVRRFLGREGQLNRAVAWSLAVRLADDMVARVAEPAPEGVSPVEYLAALAAERQRRESARLLPGAAGAGATAGVPAAGGFQPIVGAATSPRVAGSGGAAASPPEIPGRPAAAGEPAAAEAERRTGFVPPF